LCPVRESSVPNFSSIRRIEEQSSTLDAPE